MKGLAKLRRRKGLTQGQLATGLGVESNTVWKWEHERITPSVESVQKLAVFFDISVDEILNGEKRERFAAELRFVSNREGMDSEMRANGIQLIVGDDGFLGITGGMKFQEEEDIEKAIDEIRFKLEHGFETHKRMEKARRRGKS